MDPDRIARHIETVRELSKPGKPLANRAPTATISNPEWWIDDEATPSRRRLHERLLHRVRSGYPNVAQQRRAIVLAGPPGAGKSTVLNDLLGERSREYLVIDADEFKKALLQEAQMDGSYDRWLVPAAVLDRQSDGEQFYPLELASLVHEESSFLAKKLRSDAMNSGDNILIDAVLGDEAKALALGKTLDEAGYDVEVIDVEVPYELSEARIRGRWEAAYVNAVEGGDSLGGRWVPSEYAREIFDGPDGRSRPECAARALAEECPAVARFRVFRTTMEEARAAEVEDRQAHPALVVDQSRSAPGAELHETPHSPDFRDASLPKITKQ